MAKMKKEQLAEILKRNGYFWRYKYISDITKDYSWKALNFLYKELLDEENINMAEQ